MQLTDRLDALFEKVKPVVNVSPASVDPMMKDDHAPGSEIANRLRDINENLSALTNRVKYIHNLVEL